VENRVLHDLDFGDAKRTEKDIAMIVKPVARTEKVSVDKREASDRRFWVISAHSRKTRCSGNSRNIGVELESSCELYHSSFV
jgi:hypothetical protein